MYQHPLKKYIEDACLEDWKDWEGNPGVATYSKNDYIKMVYYKITHDLGLSEFYTDDQYGCDRWYDDVYFLSGLETAKEDCQRVAPIYIEKAVDDYLRFGGRFEDSKQELLLHAFVKDAQKMPYLVEKLYWFVKAGYDVLELNEDGRTALQVAEQLLSELPSEPHKTHFYYKYEHWAIKTCVSILQEATRKRMLKEVEPQLEKVATKTKRRM